MAGFNPNGARSLGTKGSDIYTPSFCAEQSPVNINLPDSISKSVLFANRVSFGFATHVGYKHLDPKDRANDFIYDPIVRMVHGESIVHLRTGSSNEIKFPAEKLFVNGALSPVYMPCREDFRIEEWRKVGRDDNTVSYVEPEKEIRWLVAHPQEVPDSGPDTPLHKPITRHDYNGPIGKYGPALSMLQNRIQNVKDILVNSERRGYDGDTVDFSEFLSEENEDFTPRIVNAIGIENLGSLYSARLYYDDDASTLIFNTDFYNHVKAKAKTLGLQGREELEYIIRETIYHELDHNSQPHMSKRKAETKTGEDLAEFFLEKAKGLEGTRRGEIYKALSEDAERYARFYREGGVESSSKSKNLESRIESLETEAESLGLSNDEAVEYITRNLEEKSNQYYEENEERGPSKADKGYEKVDDYHNNQTEEEEIGENPEDTDGCTD